ncbi:Glucans biosynthesis protein C [Shewanella sp. P1-14-1]|uniref:acyltransferase family protein n=1 Tax=Shewanella sp. P1-14-1 TaxID=1723761 RepID=UPI0006E73045|nr:acyltransferase family protein [Shewanella sp. P1-14-1]KPZ70085.1 Glucans biosynthesis protein C [Shewanella sp. P1-14-1]
MNYDSRYSELDWLRVILIFAVFLHHVLMPFNGDDWHIMNTESSKLLDDIMLYFEQFRLPTLFFISGAGCVILLSKISVKQFFKDKFTRLFIPLLVGSLLIIPPQTYIENINELASFWQAYPALALKLELNHLWFIEYLIAFSVISIPINAMFQSRLGQGVVSIIAKISQLKIGLLCLVVILIFIKIFFSIYFPSDGHKIENLSSSSYYFFFFVSGMLFIRSTTIWQAIRNQRRINLFALVVFSALFYAYYYSPDLSEYLSLNVRWGIWWLVCCLVAWSALLSMLGYTQHYLTVTPNWLKESNQLIYPFYILHQSVIVVIGYFVISLEASISIKIILLFTASFTLTSAICAWLIRPFNVFRAMFGLKLIKSAT